MTDGKIIIKMTVLRLCLFFPLVFVILMLSAKVCQGALATVSTIETPNFPNNYPNNRNVRYNITVTEGFHITLNFTTFNLEADPTCSYDYVEIRDGGNDTSALIDRYCNTLRPFAVRSSGNQILIKFVTDGSINKTGFRATYTPVYLGTLATSSTIQSPNFPNNYPNNWNVRYNITVTEGFQVTLNFTTFDLETHLDCPFDYVEIRDGGSDTSALIGRYCKTVRPFAVRSSGNQIMVKFVTDGSISKSGFRATLSTDRVGFLTTDSAKTTVTTTYASKIRATATEYATATPSTDSKATQSSMAATTITTATPSTTITTSTEILTSTTSTATSSTDATTISTATTTPKRSTTSTATTITTATPSTILTILTAIPTSTTSTATASHTDATTITTATPSTTTTAPTAIPTSTTSTTTASHTDATTITTATPSTTNTDSTAVTTSNTNAVASTVYVVTTSEELPFDTDGSQNLTLTCDVDKVSLVTGYRWSVTCKRQTGNTCVFLPQPEDDGNLVTCTVTLVDGESATGSLKLSLNYPPLTPPVITGYKRGEVLKAGDDLRFTCSVHGGKPLVHNVIFTCYGHPDTAPDITGQTEVQSAVQFTPLTTEEDGKRCTCTAEWKNTDWYFLSATTILRVNATMKGAIEDHGEPSIPAVAGGVGVVVVILIVIVVVVVAAIRRRNGQHDYDRPVKTGNSTNDPASPHPGLAPFDGQAFVVSNWSVDPIATPDTVDGTADNNRISQYAEIGEVSDAPPVPSRRQLSSGSTDSYIQPITEPEHDYIECIGP